jgi:hypothetical protein
MILDDGPNGTQGTEVGLDRREDGAVPIKYRCGGEEFLPVKVAFKYKSDWERGVGKFPPRCPKCRLDPDFHDQKNGTRGKHGGAHNVIWNPELRAELLAIYEDMLKKIRDKDSSLPKELRDKASLRGNRPGDVALDYAAEHLKVKSNEYLRRTVLPEARRERGLKTMDIQVVS